MVVEQRSYSEMAEGHRDPGPARPAFLELPAPTPAPADHGYLDDDGDSLFIPQLPPSHREQSATRQRLALPPMRTQRFAGDGYDYRRPVMSGTGGGRAPAAVIDLTEDDGMQETHSLGTRVNGGAGRGNDGGAGDTAVAGSSRARRPPRFGRDIIDLDNEPEEPGPQPQPAADWDSTTGRQPTRPQFAGLRRPAVRHTPRQPTPPNFDDDLEIVHVSERPPTASRQHTPPLPNQRSVTPYPGEAAPIDLTDDDDVMITSTRTRTGGINGAPPGATAGVGTRSEGYGGVGLGRIADILRGEGRNVGNRLMARLGMEDFGGGFEMRHRHRHHGHGHGLHGTVQFDAAPMGLGGLVGLPGPMDFDTPAFDMGLGGNRPPTPKYSPPPQPADGFTRSPTEEDEVVCPNCGDELGLGDGEMKQQIWCVKGCGHVSPLKPTTCLSLHPRMGIEAYTLNIGLLRLLRSQPLSLLA